MYKLEDKHHYGKYPLYVVDGIPISSQELDNGNNTDGVNQQSRVADINPNSIECHYT
jgi:hypothetical protein